MKNITRILTLATFALVAVGCQTNEIENEINPQNEVMTVVVDNGEARTAFTDGEGLKWENGDYAYFRRAVVGQNGLVASSSEDIGDGATSATFTFGKVDAGNSVWFAYATNVNIAGAKHEFTLAATQTQTVAGVWNKENIILRSDVIELAEDMTTVTPKMSVVGSVQRFLVYSASGKYSDEKVESIKMSADVNIAGLFGYNNAGKPINNDSEEQSIETIYWNQSKTATVNITTPSAVAATDRKATSGHGIYLAVAPVTVSSYSYIITTDKATYTLISVSGKTFNNGELNNIFVNLESNNILRADLTAPVLTYKGGLGDSYTVPAQSGTNPLGYYEAYVDDEKLMNTAENKALYTNVEFTITDTNGNDVDWISCGYRENDTWWDVICSENTSEEPRTAVITATFNAPGYNITNPVKRVTVTQVKGAGKKEVEYRFKGWTSSFNIYANAYVKQSTGTVGNCDRVKLGTITAVVDGVNINDVGTEYFTGLGLSSSDGWLRIYYAWGSQYYIEVDENTTGDERTGTVTITLPEDSAEIKILNAERTITATVVQSGEYDPNTPAAN